MASTSSDSENELKSWLKVVLKDKNLKDISVKIQGNTEKGAGYIGDIVFVSVEGTTDNQSVKKYDLVLKCSKKSKVLREKSPVKQAFVNEIFMYQEVFPYFIQYQKEKGVKTLFDNVPKCYGTLTGENMEVIALENLKSSGYELWPKKLPLSRRHIYSVVTEYGKYHATSLAIQIDRPAEFQKFADTLINLYEVFAKTGDMQTLYGTVIDQSCELLKDDLDQGVLLRWKGLKNQINAIFECSGKSTTGMNVILHGDSWSNNFMYLHQKNSKGQIPSKVVILDWQLSIYGSPIKDLSYFLFCCISDEDLEVMGDILLTYHTSFVNQLVQLGIENSDELYPLDQFLAEWNNDCKHGILMASLLLKMVSIDEDEVTDMAEVVENGKDYTQTFAKDIKDTENFKRRIRPIVEYAVKHNLI